LAQGLAHKVNPQCFGCAYSSNVDENLGNVSVSGCRTTELGYLRTNRPNISQAKFTDKEIYKVQAVGVFPLTGCIHEQLGVNLREMVDLVHKSIRRELPNDEVVECVDKLAKYHVHQRKDYTRGNCGQASDDVQEPS
jgi:hypothetical protein